MIYDQTDIAPTLAEILNLSYDIPSGNSIEEAVDRTNERVILAIIDSLDWQLYEQFGRSIVENLAESPLEEYKIQSRANKTSPAIATILTGLYPEEHQVFSTQDAKNSEVLNLPEFAEKKGVKSTVIMEAEGARTFLKNLSEVVAVEDTEDIDYFDNEILSGLRRKVNQFEFIVCHLRTVDEYLHQGKSEEEVKISFEKILRSVVGVAKENESLLIITGDHKVHGEEFEGSEIVPLILIDFRFKEKETESYNEKNPSQ